MCWVSLRSTQPTEIARFHSRPTHSGSNGISCDPLGFVIATARDPIPKRRVRPIACRTHQSVLYRIEMNVVEMRGEIAAVADCVLPEPSLPYALLAL